jgi:TRAP-type C4-dicarboxylate transport system permease small subunit
MRFEEGGTMAAFVKGVEKLTSTMYFCGLVVLTLLMLLTVSDVILRYLGRPIPGTYELVGLAGALVIGLAIPYTSLVRGHVYMEFLIERFSREKRAVVLVFTKILILLLFLAFTINLLRIGMDMAASGEVTQILRIPYYPVAYVAAVCCLIECLVMICDIDKLVEGHYE